MWNEKDFFPICLKLHTVLKWNKSRNSLIITIYRQVSLKMQWRLIRRTLSYESQQSYELQQSLNEKRFREQYFETNKINWSIELYHHTLIKGKKSKFLLCT